jgi:hypothetical protein
MIAFTSIPHTTGGTSSTTTALTTHNRRPLMTSTTTGIATRGIILVSQSQKHDGWMDGWMNRLIRVVGLQCILVTEEKDQCQCNGRSLFAYLCK